MLRGMRDPRAPKRRLGVFRPTTDRLERRDMFAIDLAAVATNPYGVLLAGGSGSQGVGYDVAYLGDINGDGYDDFAVGAPTATRNGINVGIGSGNNSNAYLVFGSRSSSAGVVDWLNLNTQQRVGSLSPTSLGQTNQTNPINDQPGFNFAGLVLTSSLNPNAALGSSVAAAGDVNGDGFQDILVGASNALDSTGTVAGAGRAYLIYGSPALNQPTALGNTIDVDNPPANVNIITFVNSGLGVGSYATGTAVAGVGDVITDTFPDIAIGAPGATVGNAVQAGAAYVISGTVLRQARTVTIDLSTVGQPGAVTTAGVILTGTSPGDQAGFSISAAGNVDGDTTSAGTPIPDMLIGSPGAVANAGRAYLLYGAINLPAQATVANNANFLSLGRLGTPTTGGTTVAGAIFNGPGTNDLNGFSVSSAGDFNADGFSDVMFGAPGFLGSTGLVTLVYGRSGTGTPGRITGTFTVGSLPTTLLAAGFTGTSTNNLAGYSISEVGRINTDQPNEIIIGAPGFNNGTGAAYLIPGNFGLIGTFSLANAESAPLAGTLMTVSGSVGGAYLGSSVSGRLTPLTSLRTMDNDLIGDMLVGASGFGLNGSTPLGGGVFALEGAFVPLQVPPDTSIVTEIGVEEPFGPFQINATTPAALDIYVFSNATITPPFRPATDIDPTTVVVNGVAFPNATVATDIDRNGDGIPEAIVTITPRSDLGLNNGVQTFTISGLTLGTSPLGVRRWTGSTTITVVGGGNNGGGGAASAAPSGFVAATVNTLQFGERLVPTPSTFSRLRYRPIPAAIAVRQFYPKPGFALRLARYYGAKVDIPNTQRGWRGEDRTWVLPNSVFTRGRIKQGQDLRYVHNVPVVPTTLQVQGTVPRASRPFRAR